MAAMSMLLPPSASLPAPPHAPLTASEAGSFAEATITQRLPAILASTIKDLEALAARSDQPVDIKAQVCLIWGRGNSTSARCVHGFHRPIGTLDALHSQMTALVSDVGALRDEILSAGPVTPPVAPPGASQELAASVTSAQLALQWWQVGSVDCCQCGIAVGEQLLLCVSARAHMRSRLIRAGSYGRPTYLADAALAAGGVRDVRTAGSCHRSLPTASRVSV